VKGKIPQNSRRCLKSYTSGHLSQPDTLASLQNKVKVMRRFGIEEKAKIFPSQFYIAILVAFALFGVEGLRAQSASLQELSSQLSEIQIFSAPDESSLLVESIRKGEPLSPLAETRGAGDAKWYLVQTKNGTVGWFKSNNSEESRKLEAFFKSRPNEVDVIAPTAVPLPPSGAPSPGSFVIPVLTTGSSVIVRVTLNHSLTAYLILDTGATTTMVSRRIAHDLALHSVGYRKGYTVGGPVTRPVAQLQSLKVGEAEVQNLLVSIHDFHPNPQIEGLLGLDFLNNFHVSLDAKKKLLTLTRR
jgi:hypothetical protein